jgi:hypothetical protein
MEVAPAGVLGRTFLAMTVPVCRTESIVEMRCDAENKQKQIPRYALQ